MQECELAKFVVTTGDGRDDRDVGNTPGERSLAALVRSATLDPVRAIREFRTEATAAAAASATTDLFTGRQLQARSNRYARAAAIVQARCWACGMRCVTEPSAISPAIWEQ